MAFPKEPARLKNDELRRDYIVRRRAEGASYEAIHQEINSPALFTGGKNPWRMAEVLKVLGPIKPAAPKAAETPAPAREAITKAKRPIAQPPQDADLLGELDADEIAVIQAEARAKVSDENRKANRDRLLKREMEKYRAKDGQRTGNPLDDELVNLTIDLAPFADRISINYPMQDPYMHGQTYTMPRHVARSVMEIMQRTHRHQAELDGKPVDFYQRQKETKISPKGVVHVGLV